jgi:hypothetical protein
MPRARTGSFLGAFYVLVGAALLVSALFAPWYFYDGQAVTYGGSEVTPIGIRDTSFFLAPIPGIAPVQATCPVEWPVAPAGGLPGLCPISTSYSDSGFNDVSQVATLTFALAAAGAAVAAVGGVLGLLFANVPRRRFPELLLTFLATALAMAATATFAVLLPGAFAKYVPPGDWGRQLSGTAGPWSSFLGSVTYRLTVYSPPTGQPTFTASWGPGIGWALSVVAIPVLLLGAVMMIRFRHDATESAPPTASAEPDHEATT